MAFDPFGDRDTRGYLRNRLGTNDPVLITPAADYGLGMGLDARRMRANPGEVFGALAYAHPFLDGNGRTIMTMHADLSRRAGFHVNWAAIGKDEFLTTLTAELRQPGSALDALLLPHVRPGPLPIERTTASLERNPGLNRSGPSPSP